MDWLKNSPSALEDSKLKAPSKPPGIYSATTSLGISVLRFILMIIPEGGSEAARLRGCEGGCTA